MTRERLVADMRDVVAHAESGTVTLAPTVRRVPARNYVDPGRFELERDRIFGRLPLVVAMSCELPDPGSYRSLDVAGTPLLVVRGDDGRVRAFLAVCRHRGALVVPEGSGRARRFSCPYHAWTYDTDGRLVGVPDRVDVGLSDDEIACLGLPSVPCEERAGLVFAGLRPTGTVPLDVALCGYGEVLDTLGLGSCHHVGSQRIAGPNWKIAYDGYLDFYHLPVLHRASFGPGVSNRAVTFAWGPHQRNIQPDARALALRDVPEADWSMRRLVGGVWTVFPHVSIASFDAGGPVYMVSQLLPGDHAGESVTVQHFLAPEPVDEERQRVVAELMAFLFDVVRDEDYATGAGIQRGLRSGALDDVVLGRHEAACQRFHAWVDALVAAETPADAAACFAASPDPRSPGGQPISSASAHA